MSLCRTAQAESNLNDLVNEYQQYAAATIDEGSVYDDVSFAEEAEAPLPTNEALFD